MRVAAPAGAAGRLTAAPYCAHPEAFYPAQASPLYVLDVAVPCGWALFDEALTFGMQLAGWVGLSGPEHGILDVLVCQESCTSGQLLAAEGLAAQHLPRIPQVAGPVQDNCWINSHTSWCRMFRVHRFSRLPETVIVFVQTASPSFARQVLQFGVRVEPLALHALAAGLNASVPPGNPPPS